MPDRMELEQELTMLDRRREALDGRIRDAVNRQRYCQDPGEIEQARVDESACMKELDRLMTRYRAVEGKLLLLQGKAQG